MTNKRRHLRDRLKEDLQRPAFREAFDAADIPVRLAIQLAEAREAAHLTQGQLARKIGTKQQAISRIESKPQNLTIETLQRIVEAVGARLVIEVKTLRHA